MAVLEQVQDASPVMPAGAHFAALPTDPLAAYAVGMLHMLQRARASFDCGAAACEAMRDSDAVAAQVLAFLSDARVPLAAKHALVAAIEGAADIAQVNDALRVHAPADDASVALGGAVSANQRLQAPLVLATTDPCRLELLEVATVEQQACLETLDEPIPEALGCAICCDELMIKPVSLLCGHSFCKRCLDMWLKSCGSCPTCRQPVLRTSLSAATTAVNVALHEVMASRYPAKLKELEYRDHMARLDVLRALIAKSIASGQSIRELVAQQHEQLRDGDHDPQADVSQLLESDTGLQEQVMAAEIRERLRKEKALREASRRRHLVAYCGSLPAASNVHMRMMNANAANAAATARAAPTPSVQSHRPIKKYVPPAAEKKSAFFGNLLRRMHHSHDDGGR